MYIYVYTYTHIFFDFHFTYRLNALKFFKPAPFLRYDDIFIVVVQLLSHVRLLVTPWTAARQASLSKITSQNALHNNKIMNPGGLLAHRRAFPQWP